MRTAIAFLFLFACSLVAQVIPDDRMITWQGSVGIPGGVPTVSTIFTNMTGLDNTGATSVTAKLQAALDACPSNQVVNITNAGRFQITNTLLISASGRVLRGLTNTILEMNFQTSSSASGVRIGSALGGDTTWAIASTAPKGTNSLVLVDATGLAVNQFVYIEMSNDVFEVSNGSTESANPAQDLYFGTNYINVQVFRITAVSGNTITFDPPLMRTWTNSFGVQLHRKGNGVYVWYSGVENLKIVQTSANGDKNFEMQHAAYCWLKGVESTNVYKYHCQIQGGYRCEVRDSYFHDSQGSTSGGNYGISLAFASGFCLVENNIVNNCITSLLLTEMSHGNVFGYNYIPHVQYSPTNWLQADMTSHDGHPMMNLFEGNVGHMFVGDYIHGSSSRNTLFRDRLDGSQSGTDTQNRSVMLDMFNQYYNIVGCVLGSSNAPASYEAVGPSNLPDTTGVVYQLGYGQLSAGSFVFLQTNVANTTLRKANYCTYTGFAGIPVSESIGATNLFDSYYQPSKPAWFGDRPWPPIDPGSPATAVATNIPAGFRYYFGFAPPSGTNSIVVGSVDTGTSVDKGTSTN